ncbi:MAG: hypothetical protein AB9869_26245 [Verrucomicrobiia bacterium]
MSRIQKLVERKEALAQEIERINRELQEMESGATPTASVRGATRKAPSPKPGRPAAAKKSVSGKARRGELKKRIVAQLKTAGKDGVKVKDLAAKLGSSYGNITAFFQSTGQNIPQIKKVGPAQYAWAAE